MSVQVAEECGGCNFVGDLYPGVLDRRKAGVLGSSCVERLKGQLRSTLHSGYVGVELERTKKESRMLRMWLII